jgi:Ca2+-binding RTX toxin-like protein
VRKVHPRVLVFGLSFFVAAMLAAAAPYLARSHTVDVRKPCTKTGTTGPDTLVGTAGPDVLCGLGGNDTIAGYGGNDIIRAGAGKDLIEGNAGKDVLMGQDGVDMVWSRDGEHDHVLGGRGFDRYRVASGDLKRSVEAPI